jgi:hypothetical protein
LKENINTSIISSSKHIYNIHGANFPSIDVLQSYEKDIDEMDISPEEIQEESCSSVPQIDPYREIYSGVACICVANCILEEELYILLDDYLIR